jgi:hypothetical protein
MSGPQSFPTRYPPLVLSTSNSAQTSFVRAKSKSGGYFAFPLCAEGCGSGVAGTGWTGADRYCSIRSGPVGRPVATPVSLACPRRREIPFESLSVARFYPRPAASANHQTAREASALGSLRLYAESHGSVESKEYSGTRSAEKAIREAFGLLHRVNVATLKVFDLSLVLQKLSMTSTTMESCTLWNCYL